MTVLPLGVPVAYCCLVGMVVLLALQSHRHSATSLFVLPRTSPLDTLFGPCTPAQEDTDFCRNRSYDITIGGFFPLHEWNYTAEACSSTFLPDTGFQRLEAARWALEKFRGDMDLGYDLRDTCSKEIYTRDSALDFVSYTAACQFRANPVTFGIGAVSSRITVDYASLLGVFRVPVIGYAATSPVMNWTEDSDQLRFQRYYRTVPSDYFQLQAISDLIESFQWTFVTFVYAKDTYGLNAREWIMDRFTLPITNMTQNTTENAPNKNNKTTSICLAAEFPIDYLNGGEVMDTDIIVALKGLRQGLVDNATVVILFAQPLVVSRFLDLAEEQLSFEDIQRRIWIAPDAWAANMPLLVNRSDAFLDRIIGFQPYIGRATEFEQHLRNTPLGDFPSGYRRAWYASYFNYLFPDGSYTNDTTAGDSPRFHVDPKVSFVIQGLEFGLQALRDVLLKRCKNNLKTCDQRLEMMYANEEEELDLHMKKSIFRTILNNRTYRPDPFNTRTFTPTHGSRYEYAFYQYHSLDGRGKFVRTGSWYSDYARPLQVTDPGFRSYFNNVTSMCTSPCPKGTYTDSLAKYDLTCCWNCVPCLGFTISKGTGCVRCPADQRPDASHSSCVSLEEEYPHWNVDLGLAMVSISGFNFLSTTLLVIIYICKWNNPLVRASSRELVMINFFTFYLSCAGVAPYVLQPTFITCFIRRVSESVPPLMSAASVFVKTNRIERVFGRRPGQQRPSMISPCWLLAFVLLITLVMVVIVGGFFFGDPPGTVEFVLEPNVRLLLLCRQTLSATIIVPIVFIMIMAGLGIRSAIQTRHLPENFNEAKYVVLAMAVTIMAWITYLAVYNNFITLKTILPGLFVSISNSIHILILFIPKVFVLFADLKRNTRKNNFGGSSSVDGRFERSNTRSSIRLPPPGEEDEPRPGEEARSRNKTKSATSQQYQKNLDQSSQFNF